MVGIGDTAVYDTPTFGAGDRLVSPYMDNRISCIVLLMAMEQFQKSENDLYFVFTVQEELGLRGAKTAAYAIDPDYGIAVDVTVSADELGSKHSGSSRLGGGAADQKALKRASDALARRGYSWGDIHAGLRRYGAEIEEE